MSILFGYTVHVHSHLLKLKKIVKTNCSYTVFRRLFVFYIPKYSHLYYQKMKHKMPQAIKNLRIQNTGSVLLAVMSPYQNWAFKEFAKTLAYRDSFSSE